MTPTIRLLIINQQQFGYHSDTYYYCRHLAEEFRITYLCWDYNQKRLSYPGVEVVYVSREGNLIKRNIRFLQNCLDEIAKGYQVFFIKYFRGASLLPLISKKTGFLLDIRSASVLKKKLNRLVYNILMRTEMTLFPNLSIISEGLAAKLGVSGRAFILPLGADTISDLPKTFDRLHLLYVGTLYNRHMEKTILGFHRFYEAYKDRVDMYFTIIGTGFGSEEEDLRELVRTLGLTRVVSVKGQVPHDELTPFFDTHNVGISFIPQTDYFDAQPPTKNYEYLLSGMPVIATSTSENKTIVSDINGVLIQDTSQGVFDGLVSIYEHLSRYDHRQIRASAAAHTWAKITEQLAARLREIARPPHRIHRK